ncbi:MAG: DUF4263 domain-containing protein [Bacteroidetes bacterium]|nr:DUF4263 domain-containing protein [Bacteroidota bacterium]
MLYNRDYTVLTEEEKTMWEKVEADLNRVKKKNDGAITAKGLNDYWKNIPRAAAHCKTLFPNNYLNVDELEEVDKLSSIKVQLELLLDSEPTEREILSFIQKSEAYYIIGSIFQYYNFGHHIAYAFKEFQLPPNFQVDYLLIGKNSGGFEFIFIELENPVGNITTTGGDFGVTIRKGLKQVDDWNNWLEVNYSHLKLMFEKYKIDSQLLPNEFFELDKTRLHFVVVAGRRKNYTAKTYRLRRKLRKENNVLVLHYDNLLDGIDHLIAVKNYV